MQCFLQFIIIIIINNDDDDDDDDDDNNNNNNNTWAQKTGHASRPLENCLDPPALHPWVALGFMFRK